MAPLKLSCNNEMITNAESKHLYSFSCGYQSHSFNWPFFFVLFAPNRTFSLYN